MLTFKLSRRGKTKQPTYRLVVVDKKKDPWGMIKEDVGSYNPHNKKAQFKVERIKFWISKGAQPSASVHNLLVKEKILEAPKKKIKMKKKKGQPSVVPPSGTMAGEPSSAEATAGKGKTAAPEAPKVSETSSSQEKAEAPKTEEPKTETPKTEPSVAEAIEGKGETDKKEEASKSETPVPAS